MLLSFGVRGLDRSWPRESSAGYDRRRMAYDEELADRVRAQLGDEPGLTERKMFGGIAWMLAGNMAVG